MTDKYVVLEQTLETMLIEDETITARAAVRRTAGVLKHATDITRNYKRRALFDAYSKKQKSIRLALGRSSKKSRASLERLVATKDAEINRLAAEKNLLIASHRAMILSVAEMGGFSTWKRFFERYQSSIDALEAMHSLPEATSFAFHPNERR